MKKIIISIVCTILVSSCHTLYSTYQRPGELPTDSLYRTDSTVQTTDTAGLGSMPWQELFQDNHLRTLIEYALEHNTDIQTAWLKVDQAQAQLKAAKLAFLPSLTLSPQVTLSASKGNSSTVAYELPVQASWEADLFGNLRNAKKASLTTLLGQKAYQQAVRSELIATIANSYYTLLALDEQLNISKETIDVWKEQERTILAKFNVGEETENALTQARASLRELEATYNDLLRQQRETENALCTLAGMTSRTISRGTLKEQKQPENVSAGIPLRLLSKRPDVVQAEMTLANAFYTVNQARSAFYPNLTLTGSLGWTNALGQAVSNPGGWIASAIASVTQPLFSRGKLKSNLRIAQDEEQIALLNYKQALLDAGNEVNNYLYAIASAERSLEKHRLQCQDLERTVKTSEALYQTANATYLELLTARQSLLNARLSVVTDTYTRCQAVVNLYNALGGGSD